nr:retrotransposon protein, putative, Ty1-copia subclass [Tanacetum cinerariifolium]
MTKSDQNQTKTGSVEESSRKGQNRIKIGQKREALKKYQENDKIGSKLDKNEKRGEARKSQKQLQWIEQEKLNKTKTVTKLHAMLKLHEQTLPKKEVAPALHAIRAGKVQKKHKNNKLQLAARGNNHGKGKYKLAYAPKPKISPPPKKDNTAKDAICHQCGDVGIFTIELYNFSNNTWVYDTGCGTHICITTQGLKGSRKLKPGALSLYVGDGHRATVEAIGSYHLYLSSRLVLVLHNCHYAPSITRGIILVFRLYDDGFINRFDENNTISVSRNNVVYFSNIPRNGIYEIDLSNSNTNDYSITVSKQGASYFVTFTNDFSHYGYVYLLKYKHEVFETFKVFQKEVEYQFGKTIKSLRSDRGGYPKETMSYSFYYPLEKKIFVARNAEFLKNSLMTQEASEIFKDLEIIQEEDTHPSVNTSLHHDEDDQKIDKPRSDIIPIRSKWLFKKKTDMDGVIHTYKARLVAKGFTQTYGVEYEETFSPVADIKAIRIFIAIAAYYDYEIWKMDVKTAFLNGHLFEKVYMVQPEGEAAYVLGIKIYRDISRWLIGLCQSVYIEKILKIFHTENSKRRSILTQDKPKLCKSQGVSTPAEVFILNGVAVDWKSTKQSIFATSFAKAEYIAAYDASKEAVWIRKFIYGLGIVPTIEEPITMYCDNTEAITIANESGITKGARHYRAKVHYLREVIELGNVKIEKVIQITI